LLVMTAQHALVISVGGSGGDGLSFRNTAVLHDKAFADVAVIVLLTSAPAAVSAQLLSPGPSKVITKLS
jgi:hypothetical protein